MKPGSAGAFSSKGAFTITQVVVILVLLLVALLLAWPAWKSGLRKRDLTRTMNHGRELYLAAFRMANDGAAKSNADLAWPGDYPTNSLTEYCDKLVRNQYVAPADLQRILSAPGAACTARMSGPPGLLLLSGKTALHVYKARASDPSNTIFAASSNYLYGMPLDPNTVPFGDSGFVVIRKSGDAGVYKPGQATPAGFESPEKFQTDIGTLPATPKDAAATRPGATVLTPPPW